MEDQCLYRCRTRRDLDNQDDLDLFEHKRVLNEHRMLKKNNLDCALNELGLLSTITNSRLEYLEEKKLNYLGDKMKNKSSNLLSSAPLCVVHMNSEFVTQFSLSKNPVFVSTCESSDESYPAKRNCKYKKVLKNYRRDPYAICKRGHYSSKHLRIARQEQLECKAIIHAEERASPPVVTRQDSGNKSNPSSPVKSQNSVTSVGCSIFRSRSLDDLEISKLDNLNEDTCDLASHGEIDTVSQRISKLQVS